MQDQDIKMVMVQERNHRILKMEAARQGITLKALLDKIITEQLGVLDV